MRIGLDLATTRAPIGMSSYWAAILIAGTTVGVGTVLSPGLLVTSLGAMVVLTIALKDPQFSAMSAVAWTSVLPAVPDDLSPTVLAFAMLVVLTGIRAPAAKLETLPSALWAFLLFAASSILWAESPLASSVRQLVPFLVVLSALWFAKIQHKYVVAGALLAGIVLSLRALHAEFSLPGRITWHSLDFIMPNAMILVVGTFAYVVGHKHNLRRSVLVMSCGLLGMTAILSGASRGMMLATLAGLVAISLATAKTTRALAILIVSLVGIATLASLSSNAIVAERLTPSAVREGVGVRTSESSAALSAWSQRPLIGHGMGKKFDNPVARGDVTGTVGSRVSYVHNAASYLLIQVGIVGALLYAAFISTVAIKIYRLSKTDWVVQAGFGALVALVVLATSSAVFRSIHFNLFLGMIVGISISAGSNSTKE